MGPDVKVRIKGVYPAHRTLACGKRVTYFYHRKTGKRLPDDPTSLEFLQAVERSTGRRSRPPKPAVPDWSFMHLFQRYKASTAYTDLAESTRKEYDRQIRYVEPGIGLFKVATFNTIDCVATEKLRDWLVSIRPEGPWREPAPPQDNRHDEAEEETAALRARLLSAGLPQGRGQMLFDLALFHTREKKPAVWAVFDAAEKESEELCDDMDCLGGSLRSGRVNRSRARSSEPTATLPVPVSITAMDRRERLVTVKLGPKWGRELPDQIDLLPDFALNTGPIEAAVRRVAEDQLGDRQNRAADDLLARGAQDGARRRLRCTGRTRSRRSLPRCAPCTTAYCPCRVRPERAKPM